MKNYDQSVKINHNLNSFYIPDHPYRILIIGGSWSGKTNVLLNLIKHKKPDIDKIYLFVKDPYESKHQVLINGRETVGIKTLKNRNAFMDYSETIVDVYENLEDHNPTKKRKILIVFNDMIGDMESNKKIKFYSHWIVFKRKKTQHFTCFYVIILNFKVIKVLRLNDTHHVIMKIPYKREFSI